MTLEDVVAELEAMGSETTKKTLMRHGAEEPIFGVKVGDMKKIQKRIKKDHALALKLYDTGIYDAMYFAGLMQLLQRVQKTIHQQPNRVRYGMNCFVIAAGAYVTALTGLALETAQKIGTVSVDVGDTACKVPSAHDYIRKIQQRGMIGKKR